MADVRQLPFFKKDWNKKELTVRMGPLLLADGKLDARERKFLQKLAKSQEILEARPLCAQERRVTRRLKGLMLVGLAGKI